LYQLIPNLKILVNYYWQCGMFIYLLLHTQQIFVQIWHFYQWSFGKCHTFCLNPFGNNVVKVSACVHLEAKCKNWHYSLSFYINALGMFENEAKQICIKFKQQLSSPMKKSFIIKELLSLILNFYGNNTFDSYLFKHI